MAVLREVRALAGALLAPDSPVSAAAPLVIAVRAVSSSADSFTDRFAPLAVHLYVALPS
jgi:hypothetical protein